MDNIIKVGERAKSFTLKNQHGEMVNLEDFKGKKVLLSWHPLAWTGVCLDQMRALDLNYDRFIERDTVPLGINVDHEHSKSAWAKAINLTRLQILSDYNPLGQVSKAYGMFSEDINASVRANVLIDREGRVEWVKIYELSELPDVEEVISKL